MKKIFSELKENAEQLQQKVRQAGKEATKTASSVRKTVGEGMQVSKALLNRTSSTWQKVFSRHRLRQGIETTSKGAEILAKGARLASKGAESVANSVEKASENLQKVGARFKD